MKKTWLLFFLFLVPCGYGLSQSHPAPRSYIAYRTAEPVVIDGKAGEEVWQKASKSENFIDIEGKIEPQYRTYVQMVWDEDHLYFHAKMEEPHIWATLKQRDTVIFYNNDFEIFIDPTGDTHNYYEFEMNALNTVWDLFMVKPYREGGPVIDSWEILGLHSAVHIEGTLNDPTDEDEFWSVEIAIPWQVIKEANSHKRLPENEFWRINFSRVNWDHELEGTTYSRKKDENGKYMPEYNWVWSPQWVINMHEPEKWGYVYFSSKTAGEQDQFEIPEDEAIRWLMYDLYRGQRKYFRKNKKWVASIDVLHKDPLRVGRHRVDPVLEQHSSGWNISVKSPFTGKIFLIKEDGKFIEHKNPLK